MLIALAICTGMIMARNGYDYCIVKDRSGVTTTLLGKVKSTKGSKTSIDRSSKVIRIPVQKVNRRELHKRAIDRLQNNLHN